MKETQTSPQLYLDLMKRCLVNWIYGEKEEQPVSPRRIIPRKIVAAFAAVGIKMVRFKPFNQELRRDGKDWPLLAHTMVGLKRLDNLQFCIEDVLAHNVPGDLIETGVWRGGATIFMRAVLKAYGVTDRCVWVADSFQGLPPPDSKKYAPDANDRHHTFTILAVSMEEVKNNFRRYDLLDDQVRFLKGWFRDTLPAAPIKHLSILRLDGDMYESTLQALTCLYPKLSIGGYLIVDDYGAVAGCRQAVHDYRKANNIEEEIKTVDWTGIYWQRTK